MSNAVVIFAKHPVRASFVLNGKRIVTKPYATTRNLYRHGIPSNARGIRVSPAPSGRVER